jgi:ornithine carbamoyltransferase
MSAAVADIGVTAPTHFLEIADLSSSTLRRLLDDAARFKRSRRHGGERLLAGLTLGLILEKPSTRTRVAFEVAMRRLGGDVIVLSPRDMQLGRGESLADTARVLGRFLDAIVLRTDAASKLSELARHAGVPVINGLTPHSHPCQIVADLLTFEERFGAITGQTVAWCGDGNNVCTSWIEAAARLGFTLRLATPSRFQPSPERVAWALAQGADLVLTEDPVAAVTGARCVVTDVWCSMSDDPNDDKRRRLLEPFRVDEALMAHAAPDAVMMHCLPAHRGEEVSDAVIDGPRSVVFDEAENRLYAHQAILAWLLGERGAR